MRIIYLQSIHNNLPFLKIIYSLINELAYLKEADQTVHVNYVQDSCSSVKWNIRMGFKSSCNEDPDQTAKTPIRLHSVCWFNFMFHIDFVVILTKLSLLSRGP